MWTLFQLCSGLALHFGERRPYGKSVVSFHDGLEQWVAVQLIIGGCDDVMAHVPIIRIRPIGLSTARPGTLPFRPFRTRMACILLTLGGTVQWRIC